MPPKPYLDSTLRGWHQDDAGEWWYYRKPRAGRRVERVHGEERTCKTCGQAFQFANRSVPGNTGEYCSAGCGNHGLKMGRERRGPEHPNWRGGRSKHPQGYMVVRVTQPDGTRAYVLEHRHVMAEHLGRDLESWETVHHMNGDRADNRIENLQLRVGRHGKGTIPVCADCGGNHIVWKEIL